MIGVWTKWAGMIVCDDVEMKGREKEWFFGVNGLVMSLEYCRIAWFGDIVQY